MRDERLTRCDGSTRGTIRTDSNGDAEAHNRDGSYAGKYSKANDTTYEPSGSSVGKGNQLSGLVDR